MLLLTSACGFHLRGLQLTDFDIPNIYINSASAPKLAKEIKSQLSGAGVTLASSAQSASYIVSLKEESFERSVLSISSTTGKVAEYQVVYTAKMDVMGADEKNIVQNEKIKSFHDFTFDENAVLGKFSEEEVIRGDLVRRSASQVLRRLRALLVPRK